DHVGQCRPKEDGQQQTRNAEQPIEQRTPYTHFNVISKFNAHTTQDKKPQHNHEWQIKAAECGCVQRGESEVKCTPAGKQPDFVAVPHGTNTTQRGPAFRLGAHQEQVQHTYAQVKAVQDNVAHNHYGNQPEPDQTHHCQAP